MSQTTPLHFNRVLRRKAVLQATGISNSALYELLDPQHIRHDPTFPRPFALGARSRGWLADEVSQWIAQKAANRT